MKSSFVSARRVFVTAFLVLAALGVMGPLVQGCDEVANCSSCGSGDVYWDGKADRCRDRDNGQFVQSCCCE